MLLFHEIHCDDWLLQQRRDRATFEAARTLLDALVSVAERQKQRLALRFRHPFAEAAVAIEGANNTIARWAERGHEIGAHAHGRHVRRTVRALRAAGVGPEAIVPGLIRRSRPDAAAIVAACRGLGLRYMTDQPQHGAFPYAGLTPWRPDAALRGPGDGPFVFIDVSVNPFAWGLLRRENETIVQQIGLRDAHFDRLLSLLDAQLALPRPHPVVYFGYPFHEHQHGRAWEDLRPDEASLAAWERFLVAARSRPAQSALPREIYAAWTAIEGAPAADPPHPLAERIDPKGLRFDVPSWLRERLPDPAPLRPALAPVRAARAALAWQRRRVVARLGEASAGAVRERLQIGDRAVELVRFGPEEPSINLLISHTGRFGGTELLLRPFGLNPDDLPGVAVWSWDRAGTGATRGATSLAPGNPLHTAEAAALFAHAASNRRPTGWLTFSAGSLAPLLARTPALFFIDGESPSDRRSLAPGRPFGLLSDPLGAELAHLDPGQDAAWAGREPYRLLAELPCPYHRLQAEIDHAHGRCALHARVMLDAARGEPLFNGSPWRGVLSPWPGELHDNAAQIRAIVMSLAGTATG